MMALQEESGDEELSAWKRSPATQRGEGRRSRELEEEHQREKKSKGAIGKARAVP